MNESATGFANRKTLGVVFTAVALVAAMLLVVGGSATAEEPTVGFGVLTDGGSVCIMWDANRDFTPGVSTQVFRVTSAPENQGQSGDKDHLVCRASISEPRRQGDHIPLEQGCPWCEVWHWRLAKNRVPGH